MKKVSSGSFFTVNLEQLLVDEKIPLGATRVFTAVNDTGTAADVDPIIAEITESY